MVHGSLSSHSALSIQMPAGRPVVVVVVVPVIVVVVLVVVVVVLEHPTCGVPMHCKFAQWPSVIQAP
jgi:hypothetical protein